MNTDIMYVAVGGTFDPIHDGHDTLLEKALELGSDGVAVGLTSDDLAPKTRKVDVEVTPYEERKRILMDEIEQIDNWGRDVRIKKLTDPFGVASEEPEFDALVVSPETEKGGQRINELREERGYDALEVIVVSHVVAEDGEPISSTRILRGEIDRHGSLTGD